MLQGAAISLFRSFSSQKCGDGSKQKVMHDNHLFLLSVCFVIMVKTAYYIRSYQQVGLPSPMDLNDQQNYSVNRWRLHNRQYIVSSNSTFLEAPRKSDTDNRPELKRALKWCRTQVEMNQKCALIYVDLKLPFDEAQMENIITQAQDEIEVIPVPHIRKPGGGWQKQAREASLNKRVSKNEENYHNARFLIEHLDWKHNEELHAYAAMANFYGLRFDESGKNYIDLNSQDITAKDVLIGRFRRIKENWSNSEVFKEFFDEKDGWLFSENYNQKEVLKFINANGLKTPNGASGNWERNKIRNVRSRFKRSLEFIDPKMKEISSENIEKSCMWYFALHKENLVNVHHFLMQPQLSFQERKSLIEISKTQGLEEIVEELYSIFKRRNF
ncbi:hypothetical protein GCM10011332_32380 [Terasakiella brassicae]|uniref:Uncharacterized protein n=1 Tax=Terasakiella brassicae TaxID=1634917 RepID=A0A917C7F5_9PROT|nr:hypothetical protein [Terasakiella brassicae]GGF75922.1 hypothetical protein GCM10011332_32380 [Terasakiella brassicae]